MLLSLLSAALMVISPAESNELSVISGNEASSYSVAAEAPQGTYYVSSAKELKSLELKSSDVVVWRNGTYTDEAIEFNCGGTLRAETPGGVIFKGTSHITIEGDGTVVDGFTWVDPTPVYHQDVVLFDSKSKNCVLQNCVITGFNLDFEPKINNRWVSFYGTKNTMRNCTLLDKVNDGPQVVVWFEAGVIPSHLIENNYFTRPRTYRDERGIGLNGQETIRIGTSHWSMCQSQCTVRANHFYQCHGEEAEIVSNKSCNNLYEGNLFVESRGSLTLRHGNGCTARGNYFLGNGLEKAGGVRVVGEDHIVEGNYFENLQGEKSTSAICTVRGIENSVLNGYWQVKNCQIKSNVIVDCKVGILTNYNSRVTQVMPAVGTKVEKNVIIMTSDDNYAVYNDESIASDIKWKKNVIYRGKQADVELSTVDSKPSYTRPTEKINAIIAEAGAPHYAK